MKELDMRARLERLLDSALRKAAAPASIGIAVALGGCGDSDTTQGNRIFRADYPHRT